MNQTTLPSITVTDSIVGRARRSPALRHLRIAADPPERIRRAVGPDGVCVLTFDRPGSTANVFDRPTLLELDTHLAFLEEHAGLKGLILTSAKPAIFIAGADLHALGEFPAAPGALPPGLPELIELGQRVFNRLAALPVPKIAAIHGACLGGGYELALACDLRLASDDKATKIGLPETQLGILPAWGGSTRLPRLIGLPKALEVILAGKVLPAKAAWKRCLVDDLAPREKLVELARERLFAGTARPHRKSHWFINNPLAAQLIAARARSQLWLRTRGHYPAVLKALDVAANGLGRPLCESLAEEREAVLELAGTESTRNLMRLFLLQERAKKLVGSGHAATGVVSQREAARPVTRAAVIGAGVMGAGIAQWLTSHGVQVVLCDINADAVGRGLAKVAELYLAGLKRHWFTALEVRQGLDRVFPAVGEPPLTNVDFVIEAAVERMDLKLAIFRSLAARVGPETILATNTSALSVSELADATPCPERVLGLHFFNPVHRMQLIEVARGERTHPEAVARAVRFVQQIGKLPVVVRDRPGFIVNRILVPYLIEAGHLFEQGARIVDIDEAMLDFGMPMGPLRLIDEIGVDVAHHVANTLVGHFSPRLTMPPVLEHMLKAGQLGRKNDHGFYLHHGKRPVPHGELRMFQTGNEAARLDRAALRERLVLPMVNEAARCLAEGVAESAADIDFAMVMGAGFAPFRGGPLRYADSVGVEEIVARMKRLAELAGERFAPCEWLERVAGEGGRIYAEADLKRSDRKGAAP